MANLFCPAIGATVLLTGCAKSVVVPFKVDSSPPNAPVEVDGIAVGRTPTEFQLSCTKRWVGLAYAEGGWAFDSAQYRVTAFPPHQGGGSSETKLINACQVQNHPGNLHFQFGRPEGVPRPEVQAEDKAQQRSPPDPRNVAPEHQSSLGETLRILKSLRDQGILSEEEYRAKVDAAITAAAE